MPILNDFSVVIAAKVAIQSNDKRCKRTLFILDTGVYQHDGLKHVPFMPVLKEPVRIFGCLLLALLTGACSQGPQGDPYFPLQEGLSWTYRVTTEYPHKKNEKQLTIENLGREKIAGKRYFIRRTSSGIDYYINADDQGVYREGLRTMVELKPRLDPEKRFVLKYPLQPGTNWRQVSHPMVLMNAIQDGRILKEFKAPFSYQIESMNETVTVPAGTFKNCIKVTGEGVTEIYTDSINGFNRIPMIVEEWYAPNVGLVKLVRSELDGETIKIADTPLFYGGNTKLELVSFRY